MNQNQERGASVLGEELLAGFVTFERRMVPNGANKYPDFTSLLPMSPIVWASQEPKNKETHLLPVTQIRPLLPPPTRTKWVNGKYPAWASTTIQ